MTIFLKTKRHPSKQCSSDTTGFLFSEFPVKNARLPKDGRRKGGVWWGEECQVEATASATRSHHRPFFFVLSFAGSEIICGHYIYAESHVELDV